MLAKPRFDNLRRRAQNAQYIRPQFPFSSLSAPHSFLPIYCATLLPAFCGGRRLCTPPCTPISRNRRLFREFATAFRLVRMPARTRVNGGSGELFCTTANPTEKSRG
jgi:hypothetical protein